MHDITKQRI